MSRVVDRVCTFKMHGQNTDPGTWIMNGKRLPSDKNQQSADLAGAWVRDLTCGPLMELFGALLTTGR